MTCEQIFKEEEEKFVQQLTARARLRDVSIDGALVMLFGLYRLL